MKKTISSTLLFAGTLSFVGVAASANDYESDLRKIYDGGVRYSSAVEFPQLVAGNPTNGRKLFGVTPDDQHVDTSGGLIQGTSVIAGPVVSNGRACSSCHRPESNFKLPNDLSTVAPDDPLFTGENADAQGDPRLDGLLRSLGLIKYRPARFNPLIPEGSPYRQFFVLRKTQTITNMAFGFALLTDGRARAGVEQARAATFSHTQDGDKRFDDLSNPFLADMVAYQQTEISPPELADLLNPSAPLHDTLVNDPFYTVHPSTREEQEGEQVFVRNCMNCHNMPNTFNNLDHVNGGPTNFPPLYGHTFDIGVAQRNKFNLDFRFYDATTQTFSTIVLPVVREDGKTINVSVVDDLGAGGATGRYEDLHRFKVPGLRNLARMGPYFHDNSAATLEEVVDYFNSDFYNDSIDGRQNPIHMTADESADLVAFLKIL
jgi:cytochrome c peroxidase